MAECPEKTRTGDDGDARCPTPEDLALLEQWDVLQSGMRRLTDQLLDDVETTTDLAPSSFRALWFLLTAPEHAAPMNQLAATLGFTTAGTTKVADRLAEAGLLERHPSPCDRRVTLARLTEPGLAAAVTAALTLADALRKRVVGPLGAQSFASLVDGVGTVDPTPGARRGCP
ncbi:MarR family transcriptional regulator [Streptomyces sp. NPDC097640]|uniref:MarR family winged helix-turn-helix transcriptional regulator n=1 Tax=Streptomyces sp. NPDC097640 TaxID=3157229 RepID=UPI00331669E0